MGKSGARKWTQTRYSMDQEIVQDVRGMVNSIKREATENGFDLSEIKQFRKLRFDLVTRYEELTAVNVIIPTPITIDFEYDLEVEWHSQSPNFQRAMKWFLQPGNKRSFTIDLNDFA